MGHLRFHSTSFMIVNFYTLHALVREWGSDLKGCIVGDVYSQSKDELTLALDMKGKSWMIRTNVRRPFQYVFRSEGYNKARRNVATLFSETFDRTVIRLRIANRDRMIYFDLDDGSSLQLMLFGASANILYADAENIVVDAFQHRESWVGKKAPLPRPAPRIDSYEDFVSAWKTDQKSTRKAFARVWPLFNAELAAEAVHRAQVEAPKPDQCTENDLRRLFDVYRAMDEELLDPSPRIYWNGDRAAAFSLTALYTYRECREESFDSVDEAVNLFVRRQLGQAHFEAVYTPLEKALRTAGEQNRRRLEAMVTALSEESRADKYERWGHLLMAAQNDIPDQADSIEMNDLFQENQTVIIPLDPNLSGIENAEKYYEKARATRVARLHAEERLEQIEQRADEADQLLEELRRLKTAPEVRTFEKEEAKRLAPFLGQQQSTAEQIPFRRFDLGSGYEVWVGKNSKQNDALTFKHARKFDYWLHARGVPGSHTLLRRPGRTAQPQKHILENAASIAAFYSKARGSHLVPVIITERKYVRKPRGAAPGTVLVEKEEVLLVEPGLPGE